MDAGGEKSGKRALLLAVGAVSYPLPGRRDPFAGGHHGGVAHRGDQVAVTARLAPQHAEAISGIVIGDVFDQAGQDFLVRTLGTCAGLWFHDSLGPGDVSRSVSDPERRIRAVRS